MLISISIDHYSNVISPADSVATPLDYINKTLELGQKAVSCCQHSGTIGYWEYYTLCKKNNLKMIYAAEVYAVLNEDKTDRTNAHLIIIAKNRSGFESMNKLISWANVNNFYYKARITFNKLIEYCNPDDIIITTGCIGGLWKYENSLEIINQLYTHFKDNFYLEIQCHNNIKQTDLNKHIYKLHKELGIKMIVGLDSHAVNEEQVKERAYYLEAKGMVYEDDGSDWNLDFPDYDTLIERFKTQNAIPIEDVIIALNNTNILLENEDLVFDKEIKLPTIYPGKTQIEKNNILKDILNKEYYKYCKDMTKEDKHKYIDAIRYEYDIIEKTNMTDYFLLNYELIKQGRLNGGVITQTGRGSSISNVTCKILGLTDFDRLKSEVTLYPERFLSTIRVLQTKSLADIDFNFSDPKPFILAQKQVLGEDHSYYMIAFGKLKAKSAFKMYAKANNIDYQTANELVKQLDKYEKELKYNKSEDEDDEENFIDPHDFIDEKYWNIYNGSLKYQGIIDSISPSPCSHLLYDKPISTHIGLINVGKEICCCIDGNTASEEFKYLKNDLLTVTVVDIIDKTFKKIGVPIIPIDELRSICKNNPKVWDIYKDGFTVGINQVEKDKTRSKTMTYAPKNVSELCALIAGVRPSFQSMIDILISRKDFSYGLEEFDNLIQTEELPQSFILYQEQIMKTLNYAGFDMGDCYTIIKQISKKKQGVIEPLKDKFIKGFIEKIMKKEIYE